MEKVKNILIYIKEYFINFKKIKFKSIVLYFKITLKWLIIGGTIGLICGFAGSAFHHAIEFGIKTFEKYRLLLFAMPIAGILIVFLYNKLGLIPDPGTNEILKASATGKRVSWKMSIGIFISTVLTQLTGGSGGREGAALQLGGSISGFICEKIKTNSRDTRIITLCGMSSVFSALFGTPVTAVMFCLEVVSVGVIPYAALVPCLISSLIAQRLSILLGMTPTFFTLNIPNVTLLILLQVSLLGILSAIIAILFCEANHFSHNAFAKVTNPYKRVLIGSIALIVLTHLVGNFRYNGTGMPQVISAITTGETTSLSFLLKIIFTAITLGCGFKGGEIVPSFFVGATFGALVGPLFGLEPSLAAAIGMVSLFCGVVNSPLASIVLAVECFGGNIIGIIALPVAFSYLLSGSSSLYTSQTFLESKLYLGHPKNK